MERRIIIYDTTLRDGAQAGEVSFSVEDKLKITKALDQYGFDYIEGGWPGSNPKDIEYFRRAKELNFKHAKLAAFGSTRRKDIKPEDDPYLKALIDACTPTVTIFGKSWDLQVTDALRTTLEENIKMIKDSVAYLKSHGKEVIYDAEHFFDGFKANPDYALETLVAAKNAGADFIVLCDTNGGAKVYDVHKAIDEVKIKVDDVRLGIHTHNDMGLAVATTEAAVAEGAEMVQGTVPPIGERIGNANLITLIGNLEREGYRIDILTFKLTEIYRFVCEVANITPDNKQPYVGKFAFAHKGGVHVDAVLKNPRLYEHEDPEKYGNRRVFLISDLSGAANIEALKQYGILKDDPVTKEALRLLKSKESQGYKYEAAEGSFRLIVERLKGNNFKIIDRDMIDYKVEIIKNRVSEPLSTATVQIKVNGDIVIKSSNGNGPVNALDSALRSALTEKFPELSKLKLFDYKVRVLSGKEGTADRVRVLIESEYRNERFGTVGVHENIVEASLEALVDSFNYAYLKEKSAL